MRSAKRVEENVGAADLTLTEADLIRISEILPEGGFGSRLSNPSTASPVRGVRLRWRPIPPRGWRRAALEHPRRVHGHELAEVLVAAI